MNIIFLTSITEDRYLGRSVSRVVMPTRPCSHVRRTPQPVEEWVDQWHRSRFTITGFFAHDDNKKKISWTRIRAANTGSNSRHTHEVVPGDGNSTVLCRNHKNTRLVVRKKRRVECSQRKCRRKKVPAVMASTDRVTGRSKILEHHTPTPLSGAPVNTKRDNLNGDVTIARTISFSNSN
jgi:hypothetical protein